MSVTYVIENYINSATLGGSVPVVTFTGVGLNDATSGGVYTGGVSADVRVEIKDSVPSPDTFRWSKDGGAIWEEDDIPIPGAGTAYTLEDADGIEYGTITFAAIDGHTIGDRWDFLVGNISSEDDSGFYGQENVYNERPSWPLRFSGVGAAGLPEWICVDMGENKLVTFAGIFNHNLTTTPERFSLKGCANECGICDWEAAPAWTEDMASRIISNKICANMYEHIFPNSCKGINHTQRYFRFEFIDTANSDGYIEIGEGVLGRRCQFKRDTYLQPGRPDGPLFYMGNQKTLYGQDWSNYYSYAEKFTLTFKNINDVRNQDEVQLFLLRVQRNGGKFIIIPDDNGNSLYPADYIPRCYYVIIENQADYAQRLIHGWSNELREWSLELKTLTTGLKLK